MSGEFGSHVSGYFWFQMDQAAQDCLQGSDPLTRAWGEFLAEFAPIARSISWSEARDSGPDDPIFETIRRMPALKAKLRVIEGMMEVYARVAQEAVRRAAAERVAGLDVPVGE